MLHNDIHIYQYLSYIIENTLYMYVQHVQPQAMHDMDFQAAGLPGLEDLRDAFDLFDSDKMLDVKGCPATQKPQETDRQFLLGNHG